jgi:predicted transcriptional regulator
MSREQDPRIRDYILLHVEEFHGSIAFRAAKEFDFTRTGISRYINRLVANGVLVARGNTKARRYALVKDGHANELYGRPTELACLA